MMKHRISALAVAGALCIASQSPLAATLSLFDYGVNIDGTVSVPTQGDPVPPQVNIAGFNTSTGIGAIAVMVSGLGIHNVDLFVDHEIDENTNGFFNETGSTSGVAMTGQSWEIDEPGFIDGDIFENFEASLLDGKIGESIYGNTSFPDDVSMAMGWDFSLDVGEMATITYLLSTTAPSSGFYLVQTDPDSPGSVYLSGRLAISGTGVPVPATLALMMIGLGGLARTIGRR
jgi:hypothetical protein